MEEIVKKMKRRSTRRKKPVTYSLFHNEESVSVDKEENDKAFKKVVYLRVVQ